jgi:hypothetical protein
MLPLRFADGFGTTARIYTFDGLADGREHLALGLAGGGVCGSGGPAAGPDPQRVLHRRRPQERAVRLQAAAARGGPAHRAGRGAPALPAPGGPRDRSVCEPRRLRPPGRPPRHVRRQPRARLQRGRPRLHGRGADAGCPGAGPGSPAEQQPGQGSPAGPAWSHRRGAGADRGASQRDQRSLPGHEGRQRRTHAGPPVR